MKANRLVLVSITVLLLVGEIAVYRQIYPPFASTTKRMAYVWTRAAVFRYPIVEGRRLLRKQSFTALYFKPIKQVPMFDEFVFALYVGLPLVFMYYAFCLIWVVIYAMAFIALQTVSLLSAYHVAPTIFIPFLARWPFYLLVFALIACIPRLGQFVLPKRS